MDKSSRKKISKDTVELNNIINQLGIINIYGLLHSKTAEYAFFSRSHRTFANTDHIWGYKMHVKTFIRIEIIQCLQTKMELNQNSVAKR